MFKNKLYRILKSEYLLVPVILIIFIFCIDAIFPLHKPKPYSKIILANDGTLLTAYLSSDDKWRLRSTIDEISPDLSKAIIAKEDRWFYYHPGINPVAIGRALISNIIHGRRVSGASTITMQTARMLEPANRTYLNKIIEIFRAFQLELHFSKTEILELYLSMLPYGGNIEGVKAASYIYFNRPPSKLSLAQSISLTIIPNDPNDLRLDRSDSYLSERRNKWIARFASRKIFNKKELDDAYNEPIPRNRYQINPVAPHFCYMLSRIYRNDIIKSTLDISKQRTAEELLKNYVNRVRVKGVSNGAVLIIDNSNSSVLAYCGSSDFYDGSNSGQVDGVKAIRSPGSSLKPALYALAFDNGSLTPKMKLLDIPTDFSGYEPENYTLQFNGDVTAEFALVNSLNIPAIRLLKETGINNFVSLLEKADFREISKNKNKIGLSMIIGGCGVKMEQLAALFSAFAREGRLYKINYLAGDTSNTRFIQLFSPAASWLIADILSTNKRPDFPNELISRTSLTKIAWKTGTSYGKRDAWAVGFNPRYTIAVWLGNFDGKGSPHLSGSEMAVPLLFELFSAIDGKQNKRWFIRPDNIQTREVCAETGYLPSANCTEVIPDYYIQNISHNKTCELYKETFTDSSETVQYCTECLPKQGYKTFTYPVYDPELTLWYSQNNVSFRKPPPHNPECPARFTGEGPKIVSPSADFEYLLESGTDQQILLQAASNTDIRLHYWYLNDKFFMAVKPGEKLFFEPSKGKSKIICMDDKGRQTTVTIKVKFY